MLRLFKRISGANQNQSFRESWLHKTLDSLPIGWRILDAGAGELQNKKLCHHLNYISQDVCIYEGRGNDSGLQMGKWDTSAIDIVSDICSIPEANDSLMQFFVARYLNIYQIRYRHLMNFPDY